MRRWGTIITAFYALVVIAFLAPGIMFLASSSDRLNHAWRGFLEMLGLRSAGSGYSLYVIMWVWIGLLVAGEALLLFLSVDTAWRRLKPQRHIAVTAVTTAMLSTLLSFTAIFSFVAGFGDKALEKFPDSAMLAWSLLLFLWVGWGFVFHRYLRSSSGSVHGAVKWLLRGSILELLIAVPAHIIARRKEECCAPGVAGVGIATGIAVMLLSFGPGVLLLYKKRLDGYRRDQAAGAAAGNS
jgi:hypothetical protein